MKISFKMALPEKGTVVLVLAGGKMLPLTRDMDRAVKGLLKQAMADSTFDGAPKKPWPWRRRGTGPVVRAWRW